MAIAYRCDPINGITYAVWKGRTTLENWSLTANKQLEDPEWPGGPLYVSDLRFAILDEAELRPALEQMANRFRTSERYAMVRKHAIVGGYSFALADEFQAALTRGFTPCIVFTALETACTWLGIDSKGTEAILSELRDSMA